jgi:hypothetical protein
MVQSRWCIECDQKRVCKITLYPRLDPGSPCPLLERRGETPDLDNKNPVISKVGGIFYCHYIFAFHSWQKTFRVHLYNFLSLQDRLCQRIFICVHQCSFVARKAFMFILVLSEVEGFMAKKKLRRSEALSMYPYI